MYSSYFILDNGVILRKLKEKNKDVFLKGLFYIIFNIIENIVNKMDCYNIYIKIF